MPNKRLKAKAKAKAKSQNCQEQAQPKAKVAEKPEASIKAPKESAQPAPEPLSCSWSSLFKKDEVKVTDERTFSLASSEGRMAVHGHDQGDVDQEDFDEPHSDDDCIKMLTSMEEHQLVNMAAGAPPINVTIFKGESVSSVVTGLRLVNASTFKRIPRLPTKYFKEEHPLNDSWTLWYQSCNKNLSWEDNLHEVSTFSTAEGFWRLYNWTFKLSQLNRGCDLSLFRANVQPKWEDPANERAGRWMAIPTTQQSANANSPDFYGRRAQHHRQQPGVDTSEAVDSLWLDMALFCIGESRIDLTYYVNGMVGQRKRDGNRVALWCREENMPPPRGQPADAVTPVKNFSELREIGKVMRDSLKGVPAVVGFERLKDSIKKKGSTCKYAMMA